MAALAMSGFGEHKSAERWREARQWRVEDIGFRDLEKSWNAIDIGWMQQQQERLEEEAVWREMDMHQRWLDNLRREVDEKVQQLSMLSNLSALVAGFAIIALVELTIPPDTALGLVIALACCTAVVVTATVLAMVNAAFVMVGLLKKYRGNKPFVEYRRPSAVLWHIAPGSEPYDGSTFEEFWNTNCHQEYKRSLALFTLAVPFFLAKLIVISFIKFKHWGFGVGLSASCIVFVGFVVWARTNLTWFFFLTDEDQTDTMLLPRSPRSFSNAESPASGGGGDSPTAAMGAAPSPLRFADELGRMIPGHGDGGGGGGGVGAIPSAVSSPGAPRVRHGPSPRRSCCASQRPRTTANATGAIPPLRPADLLPPRSRQPPSSAPLPVGLPTGPGIDDGSGGKEDDFQDLEA